MRSSSVFLTSPAIAPVLRNTVSFERGTKFSCLAAFSPHDVCHLFG